jgi:hypothetical protein
MERAKGFEPSTPTLGKVTRGAHAHADGLRQTTNISAFPQMIRVAGIRQTARNWFGRTSVVRAGHGMG